MEKFNGLEKTPGAKKIIVPGEKTGQESAGSGVPSFEGEILPKDKEETAKEARRPQLN